MSGARGDRPYVDRPPADVGAATALAGEAATLWGLSDTPTVVRVGMNVIAECGDVMIRVSAPTVPAERSVELAEHLAAAGIRVPAPARSTVVTRGELSASAWVRHEDAGRAVDWTAVGAMVRAVHGLDPAQIPTGVPMPRPEGFPWWNFGELLGRAGEALDAGARDGIAAALDRCGGWFDALEASGTRRVVCHGDVHPGNVVMSEEGPVLLDWDLLCWAPPAWDHAPMMTWTQRWGGAPGVYEAFAVGYGASLRGEPLAEALSELRLLAATLMRVIAGRTDPAAAVEAERRLRYWRGDPAAPTWTAQ